MPMRNCIRRDSGTPSLRTAMTVWISTAHSVALITLGNSARMPSPAVVLPLVGRYGGRLIDTAGGGLLAGVPSGINPAEGAGRVPTGMGGPNGGGAESPRERVPLR